MYVDIWYIIYMICHTASVHSTAVGRPVRPGAQERGAPQGVLWGDNLGKGR